MFSKVFKKLYVKKHVIKYHSKEKYSEIAVTMNILIYTPIQQLLIPKIIKCKKKQDCIFKLYAERILFKKIFRNKNILVRNRKKNQWINYESNFKIFAVTNFFLKRDWWELKRILTHPIPQFIRNKMHTF